MKSALVCLGDFTPSNVVQTKKNKPSQKKRRRDLIKKLALQKQQQEKAKKVKKNAKKARRLLRKQERKIIIKVTNRTVKLLEEQLKKANDQIVLLQSALLRVTKTVIPPPVSDSSGTHPPVPRPITRADIFATGMAPHVFARMTFDPKRKLFYQTNLPSNTFNLNFFLSNFKGYFRKCKDYYLIEPMVKTLVQKGMVCSPGFTLNVDVKVKDWVSIIEESVGYSPYGSAAASRVVAEGRRLEVSDKSSIGPRSGKGLDAIPNLNPALVGSPRGETPGYPRGGNSRDTVCSSGSSLELPFKMNSSYLERETGLTSLDDPIQTDGVVVKATLTDERGDGSSRALFKGSLK